MTMDLGRSPMGHEEKTHKDKNPETDHKNEMTRIDTTADSSETLKQF